jgi:hypothetical protein
MGLPEVLTMPTQMKSVAASESYANRPFKALQSTPEQAAYTPSASMSKPSQPYAPPTLDYPTSRAMPAQQSDFLAMPTQQGQRDMPRVQATPKAPYHHTHPMAPSYMKTSGNTGEFTQRGLTSEGIPPQASMELDELLEKVPAGYATPIQGYNR